MSIPKTSRYWTGWVRNEVVGNERAAQVRGRYLARQSDLADEQAAAFMGARVGVTAVAIVQQLDRAEGTITGWLDRTAAQYGVCAIETKWFAKRQDLTPMTRGHLLMCYLAARLQYIDVAERSPRVVLFEVLDTVSELTAHGTCPSDPAS